MLCAAIEGGQHVTTEVYDNKQTVTLIKCAKCSKTKRPRKGGFTLWFYYYISGGPSSFPDRGSLEVHPSLTEVH